MVQFRMVDNQKSVVGIGKNLNFNRGILAVVPLNIRTLGLVMAAVAGTVLTAPVALPIVVLQVAGYIAVAGGVLSAVSQVTVDTEMKKK